MSPAYIANPPAGGILMPAGETEQNPSPWTIDSLHQHLVDAIAAVKEWVASLFLASERRIDAAIKTLEDKLVEIDRRNEQRFLAQQAAIAKSEEATEKRFESVNEFRAQLTDQAQRFMPRAEAEQRANNNAEKIVALEQRLSETVAQINSRLDLNAGSSAGADKYRATLFALLAAAATAVGLAFALFGRN